MSAFFCGHIFVLSALWYFAVSGFFKFSPGFAQKLELPKWSTQYFSHKESIDVFMVYFICMTVFVFYLLTVSLFFLTGLLCTNVQTKANEWIWIYEDLWLFRSFISSPSRYGLHNLLHPNISKHIHPTVLCTFPKVLFRRICVTFKNFLSWWSFPLFRGDIVRRN